MIKSFQSFFFSVYLFACTFRILFWLFFQVISFAFFLAAGLECCFYVVSQMVLFLCEKVAPIRLFANEILISSFRLFKGKETPPKSCLDCFCLYSICF